VNAGALLKPLSLALTFFCMGLAPMHALFVSSRPKDMMRECVELSREFGWVGTV